MSEQTSRTPEQIHRELESLRPPTAFQGAARSPEHLAHLAAEQAYRDRAEQLATELVDVVRSDSTHPVWVQTAVYFASQYYRESAARWRETTARWHRLPEAGQE